MKIFLVKSCCFSPLEFIKPAVEVVLESLLDYFKIFCGTFRSQTSHSLHYTAVSSVDALCHVVSIKLSVNSADGRLSGSRSVDEGRVAQHQSGNQLLVKRFIQGAEALIGIFKIQYILHTVMFSVA